MPGAWHALILGVSILYNFYDFSVLVAHRTVASRHQTPLSLVTTMFSSGFRNPTGPNRVPSPIYDRKLLFSYAPDWYVSPAVVCLVARG